MQDFCSSFLCWALVRRKELEGEEGKKKKLMFPLKHVTSAQLTAENNLGLQAGGWLTQTSSSSLRGVRPWADGGAKDKAMKG